jgi:hypothetical protein
MPKAPIDIRSLARKHTNEAIEKLVQWMRSDNAKASPAACVALLDRGWGKAVQFVESETTVRYVARIPDKATTADTWQKQHDPNVTTH